MINRPQLPAKAGYVEIVDATGNHVYMPTQETIERQNIKNNIEINSENIENNKSDVDEQLLNIQMALCETYEGSDQQLTDLQNALCEVYELILGGAL